MQVNAHTIKTTLSDLILRAAAGEDVMFTRRGKPVVRLVHVTNAGVGALVGLEIWRQRGIFWVR